MIKIKEIECESVYEVVLSKSKFIAYSFVVNTIEDVDKNLAFLRQKYADATHICYAYSIYPSKEKSFDDAEPQGTAGKPILDCIKKGEYQNVLVAVVRYFGGIKLGAGGLVRAYSSGASNVLKNSGVKFADKCKKIHFKLNIADNKYLQSLANLNFKKFSYDFKDGISVSAYCKIDEVEILKEQVMNMLSKVIDFDVENEDYFV